MQYAILGKTGLKVSRLGFGAMRLPMKGGRVDRDKAIPMIHRAFKAGVNYIDTAVGYCNQDSQRALGEALKGWREKVIVSTKNHYYNKADDRPWWKHLEDSLERLGVETIDIYNFHGLRWQTFVDHVQGPDGQLAWMHKARDQGLIRHICFSFHDTADNLVKLAKTGEFEAVTLQYNLLDRSNEKALGPVKKAGLGIAVMGPVGGGRLGSPSEAIRKLLPEAKSVPEIALRFVLANPHVAIALSGMSTMQQVEENIRVANRTTPLTTREKLRVLHTLRRYKKLADLYCTGCNYCIPCPQGVEIPRNFAALNAARVYGLPDYAKQQYRRIRGKAARCIACGKCLEKCPQNLDVIAQLREVVRTLDDAYGKLVVTVKPLSLDSLARRSNTYDLALTCRMECHNLSDHEVRPKLAFAPDERIAVAQLSAIGRLYPFRRRAVKLAIKAKGMKDGEPLRLGPSLDDGRDLLFAHDPLPVAIARKGAAAKAPQVAAEQVGGRTQPSKQAAKAHALRARFAWTPDALVVEFEATGAFRRPVTERRGIRRADSIWLGLSLDDALGLRAARSAPKQFAAAFGFPASGSAMPVAVQRPALTDKQRKAIRAEAKGAGRKRTARVRIPWGLLQISAPVAPARIAANFGLTCWPAKGSSPWKLSWVGGGNGYVLLA